jgi:hypothetical protein
VSCSARAERVPRANAPMRRAFSSAERPTLSSAGAAGSPGAAAGCSAAGGDTGARRRRLGSPPEVVASAGPLVRAVRRGVRAGSLGCGGSWTGSAWVSSEAGTKTTARTPPYGERVSTETLNP